MKDIKITLTRHALEIAEKLTAAYKIIKEQQKLIMEQNRTIKCYREREQKRKIKNENH